MAGAIMLGAHGTGSVYLTRDPSSSSQPSTASSKALSRKPTGGSKDASSNTTSKGELLQDVEDDTVNVTNVTGTNETVAATIAVCANVSEAVLLLSLVNHNLTMLPADCGQCLSTTNNREKWPTT